MTAGETSTAAAVPAANLDAAAPPQSALRTALAGLIGNVLEWFDFAVYGYFASDIGRQFFPQSSPPRSSCSRSPSFALGFVARPVGSLVLGTGRRPHRPPRAADALDRADGRRDAPPRPAARPTRRSASPRRSCSSRCGSIQGFSLGGEFTGSMVYTTEKASPLMRGLVSSSTAAGTTIGFILGSGAAWLVNAALPPGPGRRVGLAHPLRRQRHLLHRRVVPAARHQRNRRRAQGGRDPPAAHPVARRRLAARSSRRSASSR